ncbi:MAG: S-methyl-5-thioribose-1-phosphate isomerase [Gammaproteobacteria bacterium]|nr:S-methyl-5-thioribose-1-phosphate isomerase [Gammaproteobacteria bacterium]
MKVPAPIVWQQGRLRLLDQRRLPTSVEYLDIDSIDDAVTAIATLAVRGAPAIGIAAGYALAASAARSPQADRTAWLAGLDAAAARLAGARPTAVNLAWAVNRLRRLAHAGAGADALVGEAEAMHAESEAVCLGIGRHGEALIEPGATVLTHCNAGALAVAGIGTATAPMYLRHRAGVPFRVLADETRPLLQGARLTAWELAEAGIDVTLICDNMAAVMMAAGEVDLVLVGTDRVTRNGDVVNKIGTLNLAVLCRHFGVPFYVACPSSTYDPDTPTGADVTIEERHADEVLGTQAARVAVRNPAFDVTPAALVTGIVSEHGIARAPLADTLAGIMTPAGPPG